MHWKGPALGAAAIVGIAVLAATLTGGDDAATVAGDAVGRSGPTGASVQGTIVTGGDAARSAMLLKLPDTRASQAAKGDFERLRRLPPGDEAIALARQLEAGITADNMGAYVEALLTTDHAGVERAAIAALARAADAQMMRSLAAEYGAIAPEYRGRILQVLEQAANPAAIGGLTDIVAADTTEKRSPLVPSAMVGIANVGSQDGVSWLLGQVGSDENRDFALMALERVSTPQGREMIRAAAQGSKDVAGVPADFLPALQRIAGTASPKG